MKVVYWWKLCIDEIYNSQRSDVLWRFACGDVFFWASPLKVEQMVVHKGMEYTEGMYSSY